MRIFDPHIHMSSRTTDDYETLYNAGVRALVEPSFWLGQPRTNVGSFIDYFDGLLGWERFRASQFGIRHHCTIALNPKEANDARCREVMAELPRYLAKDGVVAVGETGYDSMTAEEDAIFRQHLALSKEFELPVMVHTPHRDKVPGTKHTLDVVTEAGVDPHMIVVDHLNETCVDMVKEFGAWMAFSIYPETKMDEHRVVAIMQRIGTDKVMINSAADWGRSDVLKVYKTGKAMEAAGFSEDEIDKVLWRNPVEFYAQSDRLTLDPVPGFTWEGSSEFEGNSVLRGQKAPA